jgi:hypothetical protein
VPQTDLETMLARRASAAVTSGNWQLLEVIAKCLIELETHRIVSDAGRAAWDTGRIDHATNRVREVPLLNLPVREEVALCRADGGDLGTCLRVRGHSQEHENATSHWS